MKPADVSGKSIYDTINRLIAGEEHRYYGLAEGFAFVNQRIWDIEGHRTETLKTEEEKIYLCAPRTPLIIL